MQKFASPHWERVTPFALTSAAQYDSQPNATPNYLRSPAAYLADVNLMLSYSAGLNNLTKTLVEYWADGPNSELPPGHWALFAQAVSARDGHTLDDDAKMFFAMHNASFDAGIVAWHLKRKFNGVRPITAVRYLKQGQQVWGWGGPGKPVKWLDGGKWSPYNPGSNLSPSFPGFVSGHSTFSAASAAVLRAFTGSDYFGYTGTLPVGFGRVEGNVPSAPLTWTLGTFTEAAQSAGLSRLYAGIHFADDNTVGQDLGDKVGQQAWAKAQSLFNLPGGAVAEWTFDSTATSTVVTDLSGNGHTLALNPAVIADGTAVSGASLKFAGAASLQGALTAQPVVDTAGSFSVSGWVRFSQVVSCENQTLASQDGSTVSGFVLGMVAPCNGLPGYFRFTMRGTDADTATRYSANSVAQPAEGRWVHLVGVRDASLSTMTLYVNGVWAGAAVNLHRWSAQGAFAIGRGQSGGQGRDPLGGNVDGVRVFNRALTAQQATALYKAAR